jgi:D-alanine-D-alanine ligase
VTDAPIAIAFGGPSPEHDVSILTGLQAARALQGGDAGPGREPGAGPTGEREVIGLYWAKTGEWYRVSPSLEAEAFLEGVPRRAEALRLVVAEEGGFVSAGRMGRAKPLVVDVVVNCCHGGPGEDGTLQAALDLAGIPYTGPTVAGAALGMDKLAFAGVVEGAGLPCLARQSLEVEGDIGFSGPLIVKPRFGGSSIGVEVVEDAETARARLGANPHLRRGAVVEPYRPDLFDLNVSVRRWPDPEVSAVERPLRTGSPSGSPSGSSSGILGYADKYVGGEGMASAPRELPAQVPEELADELRRQASVVSELCQVRGVARIDFLSDGRQLYVNEINTIPGSLARYLWVDPPLDFTTLLGDMVDEARRRPSSQYTTVGADGSVLRGAGSIAAKLS